MENAMLRLTTIVLLAVTLAGIAAAETTAPKAEPKCETAEINPVTGHVLCIKPLGAPVEAPPDGKPEDARGQWSYGPNCTPTPEG
jgi:hypothetical protein